MGSGAKSLITGTGAWLQVRYRSPLYQGPTSQRGYLTQPAVKPTHEYATRRWGCNQRPQTTTPCGYSPPDPPVTAATLRLTTPAAHQGHPPRPLSDRGVLQLPTALLAQGHPPSQGLTDAPTIAGWPCLLPAPPPPVTASDQPRGEAARAGDAHLDQPLGGYSSRG